MKLEVKTDRFLRRKDLKGVNVNGKQKEEIKKVLKFLDSEENSSEQILKKQNTKLRMVDMIKAGVNKYYLRRLLRHKKYCYYQTSLYGMLLLYSRKGYVYWKDYCKKEGYSNTFEYKKTKYGWTKKDFDEYNKNRAVTLENCIKKHGEDKGKEVFENYCYKQYYTNTYEYFIEKFNGDKDKALEEFNRVNKQKAINYENLMRKYGDKDKVIEILSNRNKRNNIKSVSKISLDLFDKVYDKLPEHLKAKTYYNNKEFGRISYDGKKYYLYDFVISNIKLCIEFNGDLWHANPEIYNPSDVPYVFYLPDKQIITAKEIWEKDKHKNLTLLKDGFKVLIVWEGKFKRNKEKMVNKCLRCIYDRSKEFNLQW